MKRLDNILEENRQEALDILKKNNGLIIFTDNLTEKEVMSDEEPEFYNSDVDDDGCLPCVTVYGEEEPVDCYVLAVRVKEDDLEFLVFDPEAQYTFWCSPTECIGYSENDVYFSIENFA